MKSIGISNRFVHWTCFYAYTVGVVSKTMPLVLRDGEEPPIVQMRNGIQCSRVHFDPVKRYVAYAYPVAMEDIRTVVDLVRGFEA